MGVVVGVPPPNQEVIKMNVERRQKRKIITGIKFAAFIGLIIFAGVCIVGKYNYMYEARKAKANIDYGMQVNSVTAVKNELIKARKHLEKYTGNPAVLWETNKTSWDYIKYKLDQQIRVCDEKEHMNDSYAKERFLKNTYYALKKIKSNLERVMKTEWLNAWNWLKGTIWTISEVIIFFSPNPYSKW